MIMKDDKSIPEQNQKNASFHEVTYKPASQLGKDGVTSHTAYRIPRSGKGGGPAFEHTVERLHHPTLQNLHEHLDEVAAHLFGQDADDSVEKSEGHKPND